MHTAGTLTGSEQAWHRGGAGVRVYFDTAHHVVTRRPDFHCLRCDIDFSELFELVIHRRQSPFDLGGCQPGCDVEVDAAVRGTAAGLDL
ncbi:Uncharacterised protein [Mycobacterium tuberculosis]|uniref:C2H2-type domain-containing protein n=1 Tax=Mycobacterium tuberculosis TaxID=1773 RepID=A0A655FU59_MYCTX|nr:Uncharacterised protein [Mycobacterium tuberculosis]CFR76838.1 Uncharacterised protein [Mycobacterium tuberculosis]CFS47688.1 Uncharacterised protein [Mycobacterium tuberculosis]CKS68816.1 Uncharacterised protein [Mycobacterium tuberculosis]CKT22309.1 Uncharacterised protein [Mycobacterium tuberculosis]